jgi:hypothetical protein
MKDFQVQGKVIQIFRKEIQAGWNKIQIQPNEARCLYFSMIYVKAPRFRTSTAFGLARHAGILALNRLGRSPV